HFSAVCDGDGWILDEALRVSFRPAFRHRSRWSVNWAVRVDDSIRDVLIGIGISGGGSESPHCLFVGKAASLRPKDPGFRSVGRLAVTPAQLLDRLELLRRSGVLGVERSFLEAARSQPLVSFTELARTLGWPAHAVRRAYSRLVARGEWFPPVHRVFGRRVKRICSTCGRE